MTTLVEAPTRVDGVQLIGEMAGSGYRSPPALVRRADGQTLQLTPLLYLVLHAVDGQRSYTEIADRVGRAMGRQLTGDDVRTLVDDHLRPVGLVRLADGTEPALKRSNPLLSLSMRFAVTNPRTTRLLTNPFRFLFRPLVASTVVLGFLLITWWVFFEQGLAASAYDAFQRPQLLLLVFVVSVLSGGFHEFGHAAAARYGGAEPGVMGGGLYLVWPAFYTDVTDSYRLGRGGRIRTDLGGLHFNALVVVLTFVWWYATGWQALLLLVATQTMQMVHQLLPLLRFDGYHLLADLTGVPDLYHRIRPTLRGLLPQHWSDPENRVLKPWARAVITLWVLVTIPMMALMLAAVVAAVPRLLGTAAAFVRDDAAGVTGSWGDGSILDACAHVLQVLLVVLPMLACVLILGRIGLRWFRGMAAWSRGSVPKRIAAAGLSAALVTGLSWAWWPDPGTYRPIGPDEKGTLTALLPSDAETDADLPARPMALAAGRAAELGLVGDQPLRATFSSADSLPTRAHPQLAVVLVPTGDGAHAQPDGSAPAADPTTGGAALPSDDDTDPWVFPFDKPLPPEEGDNQAIAVNTTDDSVTYDVAFAMVWVEGDEVLNVNEAHAYASCSRCVTVAVAYQVVFVMDDARVVVPQNLAVAANYDCYRCITAALASQLVLTVEEIPGEEQMLQLRAVWNRLLEFGRTITSYSLSQITAQLEAFKIEIVQILGTAATVASSESTVGPTTSGTPTSATSSPTPTTEPSESPTSSTVSPTPTTSTSDPTGSATTESTDATTSTSPSPSPSPSPSDTTSPTSTEATPTPTATASP